MRFFEIALDDQSIVIPSNRCTSYDRNPIHETAVGQTIVGVATLRGVQHRPMVIWTLSVLLTEAEFYILDGIAARSDSRRRGFVDGICPTITDGYRKFVEDGARTRALAPSAIETVSNGRVEYFGLAKGYITNLKAPASPGDGKFWRVSFNIVETE
jgi:hypothetical protein